MKNLILGMEQMKKMIEFWNKHAESTEAYADQEFTPTLTS
jgi:hypothetical protein